jgi:flagellar FliJ protein
MATSNALRTLIELATAETDAAAKRLGNAIRVGEEADQKLTLLMQYRDDYAQRFQDTMATGVTAAGYRNFQQFMVKLEAAITGQQQVVAQAQHRITVERSAWQAGERKRMSYGILVTRAENAEQVREGKREQKQTDELAARKTLYKN